MTEEELQKSFGDFNSRYFGGRLNCKVIVTDDWMDAAGNYYPDSAVKMDADSIVNGTAVGVAVHRATALYTHSKDLISIPRWMLEGEKAPRALLLHEMAHAAADEPETDHGPKWHREMHRLWKAEAPINLHDVTPGSTSHELVTKYGVRSEFWEKL
jgi:SprT-like family